ncbi:MAG: methyltransferase [Candidatus Hydrothermarchaeales archaeon]
MERKHQERDKEKKKEYDKDYILDTIWSYMKSKIIMAANEYDLFTNLNERPMTAEELAEKLKAHPKQLGLLLDALVSIKVLEKENQKYKNTEAGESCLVKGKKGYSGDMIKHINDTYQGWGNLEKHIFKDIPRIKNWTKRFTLAMDNSGREKGSEMAERIDLEGRKKLLDVGGGSGAYSLAFLGKNQELEATILDLPETIEVTEKLLKNIPKGKRIKTLGQDYEEELPEGFDVVLLSNIIHSNTSDENQRLVEKCHRALNENGVIIIHDYILNDEKTGPEEAAIFALHMLLYRKEARTYSWKEIEEWLKGAGFKGFERMELEESRILTAKK